MIFLIRLYQKVVSPQILPRCRYLPTCSEYAQEALQRHGYMKGLWLTLKRLARCHPWADPRVDNVPYRKCVTKDLKSKNDES